MKLPGKNYQAVFFDLDHTLWDFDANARETLYDLFFAYRLDQMGISSPDKFIECYTVNNHLLWKDYHNGLIGKETLRQTRFKKTFLELGLDAENIPLEFEEDYVTICPTKTNLFPHVHEVLQYLHQRYKLFVITNGFRESSLLKLSKSNLHVYFEGVFISEDLGFSKPQKEIFDHALTTARCLNCDTVMVGDSLEADIRGARNAGIDQVFFNPGLVTHEEHVTYEVNCLSELINIL